MASERAWKEVAGNCQRPARTAGAMADYPHCDPDVLHSPNLCKYCDLHPELQKHRLNNYINFTGEDDKTKYPCPSDAKRGLAGAHSWPGNTPKLVGCNCGLFQMDPCPKHPKS